MFKCTYRRNRMIFYDKKHKETGKEYAYRVLKGNIMSLELKPGELLSESDLSEKLKIWCRRPESNRYGSISPAGF